MGKSAEILERVFDTFVPAKERPWYPWVWPDKEWWEKTSRDNPHEVQGFEKKIRDLAISDFFFFSDEITRDPDHPHLQVGLHDEYCHIVQSGIDCVILMPRNHLKSTIGSVNYPIWDLGQNPNLRILILSDTLPVAKSFLNLIRENIENNKRLHFVFPDLKPATDACGKNGFKKWSEKEIIVQRDKRIASPSILVAGILTNITGLHFDRHIYDDIITEKNAQTDERMKKVYRLYETSLNLLDRGGRKLMPGTRYRDNDLYGDLEENNKMPFYKRKAIEDGDYVWDDKLSIERVKDMKRELSPYVFSCQYLNEPIAEGDQEFEGAWIKRWDVDVVRKELCPDPPSNDMELIIKWYKSLLIYMGCDPARAEKKDSDYTVIMVGGIDERGRKFFLDFIRKRLITYDIAKELIKMFKTWNPINLMIETYGADIHAYNDVRRLMREQNLPYHRVKEYEKNMRMSSDDRIRQMQTDFVQGNIWIGNSVKWAECETELLRFPYGRHKDIITTMTYINAQQFKNQKKKQPLGDSGYGRPGVPRRRGWLVA
ncbi:MAG TPA: hypothetical protein ENH82_01770 [bacterium]|nr:hypothetical protein [bacterium]